MARTVDDRHALLDLVGPVHTAVDGRRGQAFRRHRPGQQPEIEVSLKTGPQPEALIDLLHTIATGHLYVRVHPVDHRPDQARIAHPAIPSTYPFRRCDKDAANGSGAANPERSR